MRFILYKDISGQWRWYLEAANNRKVANSGEGYYNRADCLAAIQIVKNSPKAPVYDSSQR